MAIGISAMLGAGVFYVWAPAYEQAGSWMIVSLAIAALVATLNGLSTAQLAIQLPVSGGIYSYGREYLGHFPGFVAGWLFLTGKIGSAAAIAYVAASYLVPDLAKLVAIIAVIAVSSAIISGIRVAARVALVIASLVVAGLLFVALPRGIWAEPIVLGDDGSVMGVLGAAGLMFFAFAGYARMATLGEEVRDPRRVIPRAIIGALWVVLVVYFIVGSAVLPELAAVSVIPDSPLQLLPTAPAWLIALLAALASLGSLMAIVAGLSRTALAMARTRDLPGPLATVSPRTGGPVVAELTVGAVIIGLVIVTEPIWMVGLSSAGVLAYYAIGHISALAQPVTERVVWRAVPITGLIGCAVLVVSLPWQSLIAAAVSLLLGTLWFLARRQAAQN